MFPLQTTHMNTVKVSQIIILRTMILSRQGVNGCYECPRSLALTTLGQRAEVELPRLQTSVRTQDRAGRRQQRRGAPCRSAEGPWNTSPSTEQWAYRRKLHEPRIKHLKRLQEISLLLPQDQEEYLLCLVRLDKHKIMDTDQKGVHHSKENKHIENVQHLSAV